LKDRSIRYRQKNRLNDKLETITGEDVENECINTKKTAVKEADLKALGTKKKYRRRKGLDI
jgi:hypothetical protein